MRRIIRLPESAVLEVAALAMEAAKVRAVELRAVEALPQPMLDPRREMDAVAGELDADVTRAVNKLEAIAEEPAFGIDAFAPDAVK